MSYLVLARKWRPRDFESLVGQDHVVRALTHALTTQRLHHAWLFTGTRGVGKTTLSRILAKSLNCEVGITARPCGKCAACMQIDAGRFVDYVELDAASNRGVDEMTQLLEQAVYAPTAARFKVYMIDEVHMLSGHAFNAMLKTLEEPPPHVKFILATTDPQKIPPTVLSRCLQFNLKQMTPDSIASYLAWVLEQENVRFEPLALRLIGQSASGSMRDALSLTDQAIAFSSGELTLESVRSMLGSVDQTLLVQLLQALYQCDAPQVLDVARRLSERGLSLRAALADLAILLSRIAITQRVGTCELEDETVRDSVQYLANEMPADLVQLFYTVSVHSRQELAQAPDEFAGFVMICLRMLGFVDSLVDQQKKSPPLKTNQPAESSKPTESVSTTENAGYASVSAAGLAAPQTPDTLTTPADQAPSSAAVIPVIPVTPVAPDSSALPPGISEPERSVEDFVGVAMREAEDMQHFRQDASALGQSNDQASLSSAAGLTDPSDLQSGGEPAHDHAPSSDSRPKHLTYPTYPADQAGAPSVVASPGDTRQSEVLSPESDDPAQGIDETQKQTSGHSAIKQTSEPVNDGEDSLLPWEDEPQVSFEDIPASDVVSADYPVVGLSVQSPGRDPDDPRASELQEARELQEASEVPESSGQSGAQEFQSLQSVVRDWSTLAADLPVSGMARQLAMQSVCVSANEQCVTLLVQAAAIARGTHVQRLENAIQKKLGRSVRLEITVGELGSAQTAQQIADLETERRLDEARQQLQADPFVQTLMQEMGAQIVPGSVRPGGPGASV